MSRTRFIVMSILAALAVGAFGAAAAYGNEYEADEKTAGSKMGEFSGVTKGNQSFAIKEGANTLIVVCKEATVVGPNANKTGYVATGEVKQIDEASPLSLAVGKKGAGFIRGPAAVAQVEYNKCTINGAAATVKNTCVYEFGVPAVVGKTATGKVAIKWPTGTKKCSIIVEKGVACVVTVEPLQEVEKVKNSEGHNKVFFENIKEVKPLEGILEAKVEKIVAVVAGAGCIIKAGTYNTDTYTGTESTTGVIVV